MATNTPNFNLIKPDFTDVVDVSQLNSNMDIIDSALVGAEDLGDLSDVTLTSPSYGQVLSYNPADDNFINNADNNPVMVFDDATARTTAIPTPVEGMVTYLKDTDSVEVFKGAAFSVLGGGFTSSTTITATDATFSVPALAVPIVRVTVIGGGGGGGGAASSNAFGLGGDGGSSIFDAGAAGTVTAIGGLGGVRGQFSGKVGTAGFASDNGGMSAGFDRANERMAGPSGTGGEINVAYLDLTGISTVDVTVGFGGAGGTGSYTGGAGGRGEVVLEYVAG